MLYKASGGSVKINGVGMDYISFGKGNVPLVIIPGLSFNRVKGMALPMALSYSIFAKDFKVYLFDRKDEIPEGYSIKDIADDTAAAMKKLGIFDAHILGVSQGGAIAQYLAVYHPELVRSMVLGLSYARCNSTVESVIKTWVDDAKAGKLDKIAREMMPLMYSDAYLKKYRMMIPILAKMAKGRDGDRFRILAESCLTCDIYDELYKVKCPTLVIGGGCDKIVGKEASVEIAEAIGCDIHIYENLGHAAYEEAPDFNKKVREFFIKN